MGSEAATKAVLDAGNSTVHPSQCPHMFPTAALDPGFAYDSIEAAFVTNVNDSCSTGSAVLVHAAALIRAGDARSLLALGFERTAPNLRFPTAPA